MTTPTTQQKITCLSRECAMRRKVYRRWVEQGKMSKETADREIETMQAILKDYEAIEAAEQPGLF